MKIQNFIERLQGERTGHHIIHPPLDEEECKIWSSRFSINLLPEDFLELLKQSNGIQFWVDEGSPNGYLQILPLREIDTARTIMWGEEHYDLEEDAIPYPHWLAISGHADGAAYIVLDTDTHQYYLMDACGADLTCPAGENVDELLDYIWERWVVAMRS